MDYLKHYSNLVNRAKDRDLKGYSEKHHIIPRCMGGDDAKENLVRLTAEEHFVAHQLLVKIYPNVKGLVLAVSAMCMMAPQTGRSRNKFFGWLKKMSIANQSGDKSRFYKILSWEHPRNNFESIQAWLIADKVFDLVSAGITGGKTISRTLGFEKPRFSKILIKIKAGWVPNEDKDWVLFRDKNFNKIELREPIKKESNAMWRNSSCLEEHKSVWVKADLIQNFILKNPSLGHEAIRKELFPESSFAIRKIVHRIKGGWDPMKDQEWIIWRNIYV